MGICASKENQFEPDLPSLPLPPKQSAKRKINQHLLDLKNICKVTHLSLADNPVSGAIRRTEGRGLLQLIRKSDSG